MILGAHHTQPPPLDAGFFMVLNNPRLTVPPTRLRFYQMSAQATLEQQTFLDQHTKNDVELEQVHAYKRDAQQQGGLMTQAQAAMVLGVSTTCITQKVNVGTLEHFEHFGKRLIGCDQLIAYAKLQKLSGNAGAAILRAFKSVWASSTSKV